nr:PREDICTED: TMV resistance protein N-like [Daucus carota subsp. sativus]
MTNGLVSLQQQLIVDVLKRNNINIGNVDQGIELIRAGICLTKVFIVIDDLDDLNPLEYLEGSFASGSMVLITTRNEDLLDRIKVKARYKVNKMDKDKAHQPFNQHAFEDDKISDTFQEMSKVILERAGGLPLAIQVFGSNLVYRSAEGWRCFIDKLNRVPLEDIEKNLMISFDALKSVDPILQDIFLDIVCFYIGWKRNSVAKIMETCYTFVNRNIDILKKRCLITINDEDKLGMHDLLRDMGRGIARNNSPAEPGKHSRLWVSEVIDNVLTNQKAPQVFKNLKTLNISGSSNLVSTPDFSGSPSLESLNLQCCTSLEEVHISIGRLPSLVYVDLGYCTTLKSLPDSICGLRKLEVLTISGCSSLKVLPKNLGNIESLKVLDAWRLRVSELPYSICCLGNLVELRLGGNKNLEILTNSICKLRSLEILDIYHCNKLKELPDQLGKITSLRMLDARKATMLKILPDISQLTNVENLDISYCRNLLSIVKLPPNLITIKAVRCWSIRRLPILSDLKRLEILDLTNSSGLTELIGLEELTSLQVLILTGCNFSLLEYASAKRFLQKCDAEDSNTKFLISLLEEWDTKTSIIRHRYDLSSLSLDEIYGILRTHDLEVQQRKARKENRENSLAPRAMTVKEKRSYAEKPRKQVRSQVSETDILSVTNDSSEDSADEVSDEAKMQEIMACIEKG